MEQKKKNISLKMPKLLSNVEIVREENRMNEYDIYMLVGRDGKAEKNSVLKI